jgi:hypothetical protein
VPITFSSVPSVRTGISAINVSAKRRFAKSDAVRLELISPELDHCSNGDADHRDQQHRTVATPLKQALNMTRLLDADRSSSSSPKP